MTTTPTPMGPPPTPPDDDLGNWWADPDVSYVCQVRLPHPGDVILAGAKLTVAARVSKSLRAPVVVGVLP